jgi:metallo-beta-lactamase class B
MPLTTPRHPKPARRLSLLSAWLIVAAFVAHAAAQYAPFDPEWNKPATPHRVIGNIYYVGTTELSAFVVTTPRGHILVDAGYQETVPIIRAGMKALGLKYEDIEVLLNTQAHFDHAAGLALVKRETGARLEAMGEDAALLESGGRDDFRFGNELTFPPVKVDRVLKDGDRVELGGVTLLARHTPGHTKGATTFITTVEEQGKRYEVVFATSTTVNPGTSLLNNPKYRNIVSDWETTYRVLKSLSPDVWLSAHPSAFGGNGKAARAGQQPNPYIDPEGYRRYVEASEARFRKLLEEQTRASSPVPGAR